MAVYGMPRGTAIAYPKTLLQNAKFESIDPNRKGLLRLYYTLRGIFLVEVTLWYSESLLVN